MSTIHEDIEIIREELMERQTVRDQHWANQREHFEKMRQKGKCTHCETKLYRGHFHAVGGGHSVCCACISKVAIPTTMKSIFPTSVRVVAKK